MPRHRDDRFGRQALSLREKARLTQGEVAAEVGVSERSIQFWESGEAFPTPENLKRLCALFLQHGAYSAGSEEAEAAIFWERYVESASRRKALFDHAWFHALLVQHRQGRAQTDAAAAELGARHPRPAVEPDAFPRGPLMTDWGSAPGAAVFHGREAELATLEQWANADRCQVITISGMGGVGKTTLAARFARRAAADFAYVFWRSLHNAPPLDEIIADCLQLLSGGRLLAAQYAGQERSVIALLRLLEQQRCLLILDNLETLIQPGTMQGQFRDGCEAYGRFIQQLAESPHQSCIILTSREQLRELEPIEGPQAPVRTLRLAGLAPEASRAMLEQSALRGSPSAWDSFLAHYGSNLVSLRGNLHGLDLSGIVLRQAFLRGIAAQGASFAQADAREALFTTPLETIASTALSPDGRYLAIGSFGGQVQVWQASDGKLLWAAKGHSRMTWALAFHPSGMLLASGGYQGRLRIWDVGSGSQVAAWQAHDGWVRALAFSPDGERMASVGEDATARVWDLRTRTACYELHGHRGIIWSVTWSGDGRRVITGGADGTIRAWDGATGAALYTRQEGTGVFAVAMHPAGSIVASSSTDGRVKLWDVERGVVVEQLERRAHGVATLAFNRDGTLLACGSLEGLIELWEMSATGALRSVGLLEGHQWLVSAVSFGSQKLLASAAYGGQVKLWDAQRGQLLRTVQGYSQLATALAFSPDGRLLANGDDKGVVRLWDVGSDRCLFAVQGHSGPVWTIAWKPDGTAFASGGDDREVKLWDAQSSQCLQRFHGNRVVLWSLAFSGDGAVLASGGGDNLIRLYQVAGSGEVNAFATIEGAPSNIVSLAFRPDRHILASGHLHGEIVLWELDGYQRLITLQHGSGPVGALAFRGERHMLSGSNDQLLRVWAVVSGECLDAWPGRATGNWFKAIALSHDGALVVTGSGDTKVQLWRKGQAEVQPTQLLGHAGQIWAVALSHEANLLASGDQLGKILVWDLRTGEVLHRLMTDRPYERADITGIQGLSESQRAILKALGATEEAMQFDG